MKLTPKTNLAFPFYYVPFFCIASIGFLDSIYLALSHYRVHTDIYYSSFCAISRAFNCDTVSSSKFAVFLDLPVALWGMIGYIIVIFLLVVAGTKRSKIKRIWPMLFWVALAFCIVSLYFAGISSLLIKSYCIMCMLLYLVNFLLLIYAWILNHRFGDIGLLNGIGKDISFLWQMRKFSLPAFAGIVIFAGTLMVTLPTYWQLDLPALDGLLDRGITQDGHPWIGAENPLLTINEFSDYRCFQCKKIHFLLRRIIAAHPDRIRLVHRQFPMDHIYNPLVTEKFHGGSGKMSIIALYATLKGKFWEVNDLLFEIASKKQDFNTRTIAKSTNIPAGELTAALKSKALRLKLKHDIAVGLKYGITGTPGFVIEDQVYIGTIPEEILRKGTSGLE